MSSSVDGRPTLLYRTLVGPVASEIELGLERIGADAPVFTIVRSPTPLGEGLDGGEGPLDFPGAARFRLIGRRVEAQVADNLEHDVLVHLIVDHVLPRLGSASGRCLHAAAVAIDGTATLLLGLSGSGKSTLAARLALCGGTLLGDDAALMIDGQVQPTFRGCRVDERSLELLGHPDVPVDETGKGTLDARHGLSLATAQVPVDRVVLVGATDRRVGLSEALGLLMGQRFWVERPDPAGLIADAGQLLDEVGGMVEVNRADADLAERLLGAAFVRRG